MYGPEGLPQKVVTLGPRAQDHYQIPANNEVQKININHVP